MGSPAQDTPSLPHLVQAFGQVLAVEHGLVGEAMPDCVEQFAVLARGARLVMSRPVVSAREAEVLSSPPWWGQGDSSAR